MKHFLSSFFLFMLLVGTVDAQKRPNVLFLFSDDQRADAVRAYGNPYIKTPNIDKLANQGVKFTNNYCMGSHHGAVCAPSRAMLMSGQSLFHVYDKLDGVETFPMILGENGYITFGTGKWHNGRPAFRASFQHGKDIFFGGMSNHDEVPVQDLLADGTYTEIAQKGFSTEVFANAAIDFLQSYAEGDRQQPFFLYVSFTVPHDPRTPPERYLSMYKPEGMPLPPDYLPVHPFHNGWMNGRDENLATWPRTVDVIKSQIAEYYGLVTHLDDQVGRILNCLSTNDLDDNTLIVFTSDHGLAVGSHGLLGKQNLYEHSMKAPLIFNGPGIPTNTTRDALVYLYDIGPTILNYLGLIPGPRMEGKNLMPVIDGSVSDVRSSLFTTYEDLMRSVRDHRWKVIRYPKIHHTQLFDLESDPFELNNLAEDPTYSDKLTEMMTLLKMTQLQMDDTVALTAPVKLPMEFRYDTLQRIPDRHQPRWVIDKYFDMKDK